VFDLPGAPRRAVLDRAGGMAVGWTKAGCEIRFLGPVARRVDGTLGLPDFGKKSFNTNGHSVCLRIDFGKARILLTGDLNSKSMTHIFPARF